MLGVRMMDVMCHPRVVRFYLDGELIYFTDGWIPTSELSTYQHGIVLLGGAGGCLPVGKMEDGQHTLSVEMDVADGVTSETSLNFFVKKANNY